MLIDGFNEEFNNIAASYLKVGNEATSAIRFWATAKGTLPQFSYIFHKTETLGVEFNTVACSDNGFYLYTYIEESKV